MTPELLEEINQRLAELKATRGESSRLTLKDLVDTVRDFRSQHKDRLPAMVAGARISKSEAAARSAHLSQFYFYVSEIGGSSSDVIQALKSELERKQPEKIYLPRENPER